MLKKIILSIVILCHLSMLMAQTNDVKTVLFLIPFFGEDYHAENIDNIKSDMDIYNEQVFSLVSFWEGAQLALNEYESGFDRIDAVVRDITTDNNKLTSILEDQQLMSKVNLIIGPFFANQFELAASYAKKYKIPIVNPFTTKNSIVQDNEFVYKVCPARGAMPELLQSKYLDTEHPRLIFWTDSEPLCADIKAVKDFCDAHTIQYEMVSTNVDLRDKLMRQNKNIVLLSMKSEATIIAKMRQLGGSEKLDNTIFIIPQEWMNMKDLEVEYLNALNVHYFSNWFVDADDAASLVFMSNFIEKYNTPPDLKLFSFQGYDITKYFVELLFHDFDVAKVSYSPVSMKFDFRKSENGGFENNGVFFLQVNDFKIKPTE